MGLRFILGRAGTGKTRLCLEEIKGLAHQGGNNSLIMLVPEQATLVTEREVFGFLNRPAQARVQVLSFRRLGWRVFQEVGGAARPHIGEMGKRMLLKRAVNSLKGELRLFAPLAHRMGFIEQLAHITAEFKLYRVTPEQLLEAARMASEKYGAEHNLTLKLKELGLIYRKLEDLLEGCYLEPEDYLSLLSHRLTRAPFLKGSFIWVDGFKGFTPQEEAVLASLLTTAERVTVCLCLDPSQRRVPLGETELFYPTSRTYHRLKSIALERGVDLEEVLLDQNRRFSRAPALAHLEAQWGRWPLRPFSGKVSGQIKLVAAPNRRAEVEGAAREILRLVREGLRFREIGVLVRDLEPYHYLFANIFRDYNIPFFMDRCRPASFHPLLELLRSSLETVLEDWPYEAIFRYLKTDLVPLTREEIDQLENFVLARGIRGKRWWKEDLWQGEEGQRMKNIRDGALAPLLFLAERLKDNPPVKEVTGALFSFLEKIKVPQELAFWHSQALKEGDWERAQEQEQVWQNLMDLMEEIVTALGEERLDLEEYREILEAGLEAIQLRLIPPALDQVLVGSLDRSCPPEVKAMLVLGVGEGCLPRAAVEDVSFTDEEREHLHSWGLEVAPSTSSQMLEEEFLAYWAFTRASQHLYLSYPLADTEGRALYPSPLVSRLKALFPGLQEEYFSPDPPLGEEAEAHLFYPRQVAGHLARISARGSPLPPFWEEVRAWLEENPEGRPWLRILLGARAIPPCPPLPLEVREKLYPLPLRVTVSRLETFAACPFRFFLTYGLKLREREIHRIDPAGLGQFYHEALKNFVVRLQEEGKDWGEMEEEECWALMQGVIEELAPQLQYHIFNLSARHRYLKSCLEKILARALKVWHQHARRGSFRPWWVEAEFSPKGGPLPPLELQTPSGLILSLEGRVDRIDGVEHRDKIYLRVIDYKSNPTDLDLVRIYHALSLQLPLYLAAAREGVRQLRGKEVEAAGILYLPIQTPLIKRKAPVTPQEAENLRKEVLRARGLFLHDLEVLRLMDRELEKGDLLPIRVKKDGTLHSRSPVVERDKMKKMLDWACSQARVLGEKILEGEVAPRPYRLGREKPCDTCPYGSVCGLDPLLPGVEWRALEPLTPEEVWERLLQEGGG